MKYIIAIIQPHKLREVKKKLHEQEVFSMTISSTMGCGEQKEYIETYRGIKRQVDLYKNIKLEIAVNDDFVERTCQAIIDGAHSGEIGDGKIFILDLPDCIKIRTQERGGKTL
ncbi:MAG: P-II family nitrogen regulator [Chlamydiia bacterium]|nr:P-II family nitrogen regulator [Chlamydiia bacterium]